jgi:hypothetical protein
MVLALRSRSNAAGASSMAAICEVRSATRSAPSVSRPITSANSSTYVNEPCTRSSLIRIVRGSRPARPPPTTATVPSGLAAAKAAAGPTDSELVCLVVAQALFGCKCEARWLRFARACLGGMSPYLPQRPGYNRRLRAALPLIKRAIRPTRISGWTTCELPTPPRWNAAARLPPSSALAWRAGRTTAAALLIPAGFGDCGCT